MERSGSSVGMRRSQSQWLRSSFERPNFSEPNRRATGALGSVRRIWRAAYSRRRMGCCSLQHPIRRLEYAARQIRRTLPKAPVALLFGSEKFGLSNDDLSHCDWLLRIPTEDPDLSMNLGQAVALCLYELARDPLAASARPGVIHSATAGE